ncbi:MAG: hypothetical protein JSS02_25310 [Planctomycetes bacterium]|nr:hypothetical protein [Planctomycetota bacterium]
MTTTYEVANQIVRSLAVGGRTTHVLDSNGNQQIVKNPDGKRVTTTWNFEIQPTQYNQPGNLTYPLVTISYTLTIKAPKRKPAHAHHDELHLGRRELPRRIRRHECDQRRVHE